MFEKILIANRGDQARSAAAAKPLCLACEACSGDFIAERTHV
ncbi:hypothetical protein PA01_19175 [Azoarcus sp. PA01]|nr:hypothetical protein PA01_19175 [Azoarcus sp. PA01]